MPKISATEATEKWQRNSKAAQQDYVSGINRVTEAPGAKAAKAEAAYLAGVQQSVNKWKRNVNAVSLDDWKNKAINKGAGRIASGVDAAFDKTLAATDRNFKMIDNALATLGPRGDFQQNVQRMVGFATKMHDEANR